MFEQYQDHPRRREPRDPWFYPTIIFAVLTIAAASALTLYFSGVSSPSEVFLGGMKIEGEISVVTKEQARIKVGGANVCAVSEEKINQWIDSKTERALVETKKAKTTLAYARSAKLWADRDYTRAANNSEREKAAILQADKDAKFIKAESQFRYWSSPAFYFNGLKDCESKAVTDSDGKFSLTLRNGKYALAVQAERGTGAASREEFFWLIWITPETSGKPLVLGNDNLMTANPPDKVVEIENF